MKLLTQTKALADETRLRLLGVLARHELNVGEIVQVMDMGQSRISRHLKILMDAGLVGCQRHGLWAFYSAAASNGSRALLAAVLEGLSDLPEHRLDLDAAAQVLSERRQSTTRFFDGVASDWKRLSREMLGDFELGQAILGSLESSGRQVGSMPSSAKPVSLRVTFSVLRNILRRCEKAVWTTCASFSWLFAVSSEVSLGIRRTTADCTLGGGSKLSGGTSISHSR